MMKQFKICGFSVLMDAEVNTSEIEQASEIFEMMMNSEHYYKGHIMDNYTGELYCHFDKEMDGNGIKTTYWSALA